MLTFKALNTSVDVISTSLTHHLNDNDGEDVALPTVRCTLCKYLMKFVCQMLIGNTVAGSNTSQAVSGHILCRLLGCF